MAKKATRIYSFITSKKVVLTLAVICVIAFILRVVLPMQTVFGDGYINFLEGDAYNRMWYAVKIQTMPFFSGLTYSVQNGLLFPWLIALLGHIFPIELVGAWLPPVLAVGVIVLVYLIGANVFNTFVGLLSALFVAIIPSEFYHRSLLGFPDHHVMEVFLMALVVYLVIKAIRVQHWFSYYSLGAGFALFLYLANWTAGILMIGILGLVALVFIIRRLFRDRTEWKQPVVSLGTISMVGVALYLCFGGFVRYFWWLPGQEAGNQFVVQAAGVASEMITTWFTPVSQRTISELMPLLMPFGKLNIGVVYMNLHLFVPTFIMGAVFLWYWRKDKANLFILIWALVLLVITLNERRFLYYFTLPVGLLSAWGIYELGQRFKKHQQAIMIIITTVLLLISFPVLQLIGQSRAFSMPPEWHDALVWLHDEPDNGMVSAWSDYGHWIQYTADKTPNLLPGPGGKEVADLLLTTDDKEAQVLLAKLSTGYLIVDRATMDYKTKALEIISGGITTQESLAVRLLRGENTQYLVLVYESENIKIYEVLGGKE